MVLLSQQIRAKPRQVREKMKTMKIIAEKNVREGEIIIVYRLYKEENVATPDGSETARERFSLEIELRDGDQREVEVLEDISGDMSEAERIAFIFADGAVTPNTAIYVYEDLFPDFAL